MKHEARIHTIKLIAAVCCLFLVSSTSVSANSSEEVMQLSPTPKPVEYTLPYPGLLPDHPLYFLRAVRDTIQTLFVSNPLEKAEFYLLQADKSVSASSLLVQKPETYTLAGAVAIESQEYVEKSLDAVTAAKKQGLDTHGISNQLVTANAKHQELLAQMLSSAGEEDKDAFAEAVQKAKDLEKKAKALLPAE